MRSRTPANGWNRRRNITISNLTIVGNNSSGGTAGGLWVATFGAPVNVTIADNIIADNGTNNCQIEGGAAAVLTSFGGALVDALADTVGRR